MSGEPPWDGPPSGAPLERPPPGDDPADLPRDGGALLEGGVLGRGGMGEVRAAHDPALRRDVAVKVPRAPGDDARLLAEARLTARLEHPGIVPVYRAGRLADGRAYYAMRLLRDRSLADALAVASGPSDRLALVPRVLALTQALAYAHSAGVVHRDVKPANVLIGPFGETLLTDWGLAADGAAGGGTPGYMSPEQEAGGAVDARSDVYAVGRLLAEILDFPGAPDELRAIAARASAADPADRYPDMQALADDLTAWFEGRRVAAYAYTPWQLLRRVVRAWRAPLIAGGVAGAGIVAAVLLGWWQTAAERNRAVEAEAQATIAGALAEDRLAEALVAQSLAAADDDRRMEAELLAAHALVLRGSPDARGVIARFGGRPRPRRVDPRALPACDDVVLSADGGRIVCLAPGRVVLLDAAAPDAPMAALDRTARYAVPDRDGSHVVLLDADRRGWMWVPPADAAPISWTEAAFPTVARGESVARFAWSQADTVGALPVAAEGGAAPVAAWDARPCPAGAFLMAYASTADGAAVVCRDGSVLRVAGGVVVERRHVDLPHPPSVVAWSAGWAAVGTSRGEVVAVAADGRVVRVALPGSRVAAIALSASRLAATDERGDLGVYDLVAGATLARMRPGRVSIAWRADGRLRVAGREVVDLDLGGPPPPGGMAVEEGVSTVAIGPGWLAIGQGDGRLDLRRLEDGAVLRAGPIGRGAVKDLALWPGHGVVAAMSSGAGTPVLSPADGSQVDLLAPGPLRRVDRLGDGLIGIPYAAGVVAFGGAPAPRGLPPDAWFWEAQSTGDGSAAVLLERSGAAWRVDAAGEARRLGGVYDATAVAPLGDDTLLGDPHGVLRLDPDGAPRATWDVGGRVVDLQASRDGRRVAVGLLDGDALVLREDGEVLARLRGHLARVASVAFTEDGAWLVTGSWDATVRLWSLAELEEEPAALEARLAAAWGRTWRDVLAEGR